MERWQKEYIVENFVEAIEYTSCNTLLLTRLRSTGVLGIADLSKIDSTPDEHEKIRLLYDILMTRKNGYQAIIKALHLCNQSGAAKLLLDGYTKSGIANPLQQLNIPINFASILSTNVSYHGQLLPLQNIFPRMTENDLKEIFESTNCEDEYIQYFLYGVKTFTLVPDTLPGAPAFYIPRSISKFLEVDPTLFQADISDIFVFKGMHRVALSKLAHPNGTSSSGKQLSEVTSRFIYLEYENDWNEIKRISKFPIHLISFKSWELKSGKKDISYILEDSTGNSEFIWKYLTNPSPDKRICISEEHFIENLISSDSSAGVCFCDKPGMGKTWLLANLARKLETTYSDIFVAFIKLSDFFGQFEMSQDFENVPIKLIFEQLSPSKLSQAILEKAVAKNWKQFHLFFDGLDELSEKDVQNALKFLRTLKCKTNNIKIYITSRLHLANKLLLELGLETYNILPFTIQNQREFLVAFWKQEIPNGCLSKLSKFAEYCLKNLRRTFTQREHDVISSIPLQCFLLADVFTNEARLYSDPERKLEMPDVNPLSLYEMYKRYMDHRFSSVESFQSKIAHQETLAIRKSDLPSKSFLDKFKRFTKSKFTTGKTHGQLEIKPEIIPITSRVVKSYHTWKALQLVAADVAEDYAVSTGIRDVDISTFPLSLGILEINRLSHSKDSPSFVHRSFAEYLVAEFFGDFLRGKLLFSISHHEFQDRLTKYFVSDVLRKRWGSQQSFHLDWYFSLEKSPPPMFSHYIFANKWIVLNIDMYLKTSPDSDVNQVVVKYFTESIKGPELFDILECCVAGHFPHLFQSIKNILKCLDQNILNQYKPYIIASPAEERSLIDHNFYSIFPSSKLLHLSASHSLKMFKECFLLLNECFHWDFENSSIYDKPPGFHHPIHIAVKNGDYELVEYLADKISLMNRPLLYYCVSDTYFAGLEMAEKKIEICRFLLSLYPSWIQESAFSWNMIEYGSPLLTQNVHLEILKFLINQGANVYATVRGNMIVNCAINYMSDSDLHELVRFLIEECKIRSLFLVEHLHFILQNGKNLLSETFDLILNLPEINMNHKDKDGNTLLLSAVIGKQGVNRIQNLINRGAHVEERNTNGESVLHFAAKNRDFSLLDYFLEMGLNIDSQNNEGTTPLKFCYPKLDIIKYFIEKGAQPQICDYNGNNVCHSAAHTLNKEDFHEFVVLLLKCEKFAGAFTMQNCKGETPLHCRFRFVKTEYYTMKLLLEIPGLNINAVDDEGNTVLMKAIRHEYSLKYLKLMVDHGADFTVKNKQGEGVMHLLGHYADKSIITYFNSLGLYLPE